MQSKLLICATTGLLALFLFLATPGGAVAGGGAPDCPGGTTPTQAGGGWICVPVTDPGGPGDPGGGDPGDGGPRVCHGPQGDVIPCTTSAGGYDYVWMGAPRYCYAWRVTPPPPAGNPAWEGHDPSEGSVYTCDVTACFLVGCAGFFVPGNATPPNPADLARSALDRMRLASPNIHMAPQPPLMTYVGLETWLWMDPGQWDPLSLTVTAGATSVTVVAEPVAAGWDLTAGSTTCSSAGRPWVKGMSASEQTDCSYTFDQVSDRQPEGKFPVTSTLTYQVDWTCSGVCLTASGTLGRVDGLPGDAAIRVGERQSVVIQ